MRVVIFGMGITGTATGAVFSKRSIAVDYVDPPKLRYAEQLAGKPDFIFLCVPTPTGDMSFVHNALETATKKWQGVPVVIRSTMPPGVIDELSRTYGALLILMPEFLREAYAVEDALRQDKCVYATRSDIVAKRFATFLQKAGYQTPRRVSVEACEILKTALNSMLAVKVAFANVLYDVAKANHANYDELVNLMVLDGWLHKFGLQVPGRHGRGYSGTCLPKDLGWLTTYMQRHLIDGGDWLKIMAAYNDDLLAMNEAPKEVLKEGA